MDPSETEYGAGDPVDSMFVLCRCCVEAACERHMAMVAETVSCLVCGEACQCGGCAAHYDPVSDGRR